MNLQQATTILIAGALVVAPASNMIIGRSNVQIADCTHSFVISGDTSPHQPAYLVLINPAEQEDADYYRHILDQLLPEPESQDEASGIKVEWVPGVGLVDRS